MSYRFDIIPLSGRPAPESAPAQYDAWLQRLPLRVKQAFIKVPPHEIHSHCILHIQKKMRETPTLARFVDRTAFEQIVAQMKADILEDQEKVRRTLQQETRWSSARYRVL